jgi:hypothetical protein
MMIACQIPVLAGALLLWLLPRHQTGGLLVALYMTPMFGGTYLVTMAITLANCAGYTKRSVFAAGVFIGYCCGNIAGPL